MRSKLCRLASGVCMLVQVMMEFMLADLMLLSQVHCLCRAVAKVFKGKTIEKGVAFPTCVSVNR